MALFYVGPLTGALLVILSIKLTNVLINHIKLASFSFSISLGISLLEFILFRNLDFIWIVFTFIISCIFLFQFMKKITSIVSSRKQKRQSTVVNHLHNTPIPESDSNKQNNDNKKEFSFKEAIYYGIYVISLFTVIIAPLFTSSMYFTGKYFGNSLEIMNLVKVENIQISDQFLKGKLIASDEDNFYVSDKNRRIIKLNSAGEILNAPNNLTFLKGNSDSWDLSLEVESSEGILSYLGKLTKKGGPEANQLEYSVKIEEGNTRNTSSDMISIAYGKYSKTFTISQQLQDKELNIYSSIDSISINWIEANGNKQSENINFKK